MNVNYFASLTCYLTMLGSASVISVPCWSGNFVVMSEHTNIVIFFVAYSECQSVLILRVGDVIVQDTNS